MIPHQEGEVEPLPGRARLKVLHIIDHLGVGGAQTFLYDLTEAQQKGGRTEPIVCCLKGQTELSAQFDLARVSLRHLNVQGRPWQCVPLLPRLQKLLRETQPDIVHTHLFASNLLGRLAALFQGIPTVVQEQANESSSAPWLKSRADSILARYTNAVICVSYSTAQFNRQVKHVPPAKIHVIPNSINPDRLAPQTSGTSNLKEELGLPKDTLIVAGIGRLVRQKRFDLFIDVADMTLKTRSDVAFLVVGDGPERQRLEARTAAKGITRHIHFLGLRNDIGPILDATDLFLLMSDFEGLPLTMLEAMTKSVCVVATDVDGAHDVFAGTDAGVLVPLGNCWSAAEAVVDLLNDNSKRTKIGVTGRALALGSYGIDATASKIEAVYRNICKAKSD